MRLPGGGSEATEALLDTDRAKRVFRISLAAIVDDVPFTVADRVTEKPSALKAELVVDLVSRVQLLDVVAGAVRDREVLLGRKAAAAARTALAVAVLGLLLPLPTSLRV